MSSSLDCFQYLLGQVPTWMREVEEVEKRIAEKQAEIAQLPPNTSRPNLKKSGSSESIRPGREEEEADHSEEPYTATTVSKGSRSPILQREVVLGGPEADVVSAPPGLQDRAVTGRSRVVLRKRKPASILSSATAPLRYRSRDAIRVEYDAKVQTAFNQLVQNISQGRNRIRKARMEARIMSLTGSSQQVDADDGEILGPAAVRRTVARGIDSTPTFRSSRRMAAAVSPSMKLDGPCSLTKETTSSSPDEELFDKADKYLEEAQNLCEAGAHQFLRDMDCEEHTEGAKQNFIWLKETCDKEIPRMKSELQMRSQAANLKRQRQPSESDHVGDTETTPSRKPVMTGQLLQMEGTIEADDNTDDDDDEIDGEAQFELTAAPMSRCRVMART